MGEKESLALGIGQVVALEDSEKAEIKFYTLLSETEPCATNLMYLKYCITFYIFFIEFTDNIF